MNPFVSLLNFVPSSTDAESPSSSGAGVHDEAGQIEHGQDPDAPLTVTVTPPDGVSTLPRVVVRATAYA